MMNVKNHHIFTDKLALSVVNLKHIELATKEDREWKIDYWASLFKATTWEELKMLAKQNPILEDAIETIYELTADEAIREQCKAREKHIREVNTVLREREMAFQERDEMSQKLDAATRKLDAALRQVEQLQQENKRLKEQQGHVLQ